MSRIRAIRAKAAVLAGATVLAGLGIGATATPASATWAQCDAGALCAYLGTSGSGTPGQVWGNNADLRQYEKFNLARSAYNNGNSCDVRIWTLLNRQGSSYLLKRGARIADTYTFNNEQFRYGIASNTWVC